MSNFLRLNTFKIQKKAYKYRGNIVIIIIFLLYLIFVWNYSKNNAKRQQTQDGTTLREFLTNDFSLFRSNYEYNSVKNNFTPSADKARYYRIDIKLDEASRIDTQKDIDSIPESEFDVVFLWTQYFGWNFLHDRDINADNFKYNISKDYHRPAHCMDMYPKCRLTHHRRFYNRSDMVIFHWQNLDIYDIPKFRSPEQIWQLYIQESPKLTPLFSNQIRLYFNSTSSYHSRSDMRVPYGETERYKNPNYVPDVSEKSRVTLWMVTHCTTYARRETYALRLMVYVPIDIIGPCSNRRECPKKNFTQCQKNLFKKYLFYLSFENAFCEDYVTEKLFLALQYDIIPIVYGAANYSDILPPHSYIDATKFKPEKLGSYMKYLMQNRTAYLEYFEWKRHFIVRGDRSPTDHLFCEACRYVQEYKRGNIARKSMSLGQINDFWFSTCWNTNIVNKIATGT